MAAQKLGEQTLLIRTAAAASLIIVPLIALSSNYAFDNRSRYYLAHDYVDNIFKSIEPRGMLLTSDWQTYSPALYARDIEEQRRDIIVLDTNLMKRSWYYNYLDQEYPQLTSASRDKINMLLEDLAAFDKDPKSFDASPTLNQRINRHFYDVLIAFISTQLQAAPVYVTFDLADPKGAMDITSMVKYVNEKYELIPQGLVFRVGDRSAAGALQEPQINIRGLNDGTLKFENDDVVMRTVEPNYEVMLTNTGMYLASKGQYQRAIAQFELALKVNPNLDQAKKGLTESRNALRAK
jgi:tetratricopeptide (TPR) repeat protein